MPKNSENLFALMFEVNCVAAGAFHTLVLSRDSGAIWATGSNGSGQLGTSCAQSASNFKQILPSGVQSVVACASSSYILKDDLTVLSFGWNASGQLGNGLKKVETQTEPKTCPFLPPIRSIHAGESFAMLIDTDSNVWVAGSNSYGQLGNGNSQHHTTFEEQEPVTYRSEPINEEAATPMYRFKKIIFPVEVSQISCGSLHTLFIDCEGFVWGTGWNAHSQLGFEPTNEECFITRPKKILNIPTMSSVAAGWVHSLFLDENGNVWACGNGIYGNTGIYPLASNIVPTMVNEGGSSLPSIQKILAGKKQSFCLDFEGHVYATGVNSYGELGLGDNNNKTTFRRLEGIPVIEDFTFGISHLVLVDVDGALWGSGCNTHGEIPSIKKFTNKPLPLPIQDKIGSRIVRSHNKSARN